MVSYSTSEFKNGLKVLVDGNPCVIIENDFCKPGKGQAFNRIKIRNLNNGLVREMNCKSGSKLEAADVQEIQAQYLYAADGIWHFMNNDGSYEQLTAKASAIGDSQMWMQEGDICNIVLYNNEPITVEPPQMIECVVTETDPGLKGDTVSGGTKPALLDTGAKVKVPLFVEPGEKIKVNTRTGEYLGRVSK
ncbi:MAG: elongation factor P [Gammaproteobacteria bacterium]|nr:elongation factor P [Gammaproteobacteria bacterium]